MTRILNGNDEIVIFDNNKKFEIVEHFYNNIFMGYNLMLDQVEKVVTE